MKRLKLAIIYTAHMMSPALWAWTFDRASGDTLRSLLQTYGGS